jgi:hypothetical protein
LICDFRFSIWKNFQARDFVSHFVSAVEILSRL